jgi:hypothetical protein
MMIRYEGKILEMTEEVLRKSNRELNELRGSTISISYKLKVEMMNCTDENSEFMVEVREKMILNGDKLSNPNLTLEEFTMCQKFLGMKKYEYKESKRRPRDLKTSNWDQYKRRIRIIRRSKN